LQVTGKLTPDLSKVYLEDRLSALNHMDILRTLLFEVDGEDAIKELPLGIHGGFGYDFVRQFETVPKLPQDSMSDVDYVFYLATRAFVVDHNIGKTYIVSVVPDQKFVAEAQGELSSLFNLLQQPFDFEYAPIQLGEFYSDTKEEDYLENVEKIKQRIFKGDAFQVQYGQLKTADFHGDSFHVYDSLKKLNPSPFMFYMRDQKGVLLGASPELSISVSFDEESKDRVIEITPIAGTKPRGRLAGKINKNIDQRYAMALQTDKKELAEHVMLIDLARNDVASIAKSGSTYVKESLTVKKFSHVQHLVSRVRGNLRDEYDAFTAYLATMNMGTLTGAPKPSALNIISEFEVNERGYYGGAFGFITHAGDMETAIVIRSMRIKDDKVYLRASAGIVADSIAEHEWQETEVKMRSCVVALEKAEKTS
jgi:anthranilate synthase component I